ncbi:MAG: DUF29 family protein [Chroococcidiopsidaceae cyanobacterium CP_BM_ER_R8_30]|nr:DUF29 family protein [Chroococcidiopsidaceae cyanobacterium CP_BM_ER_R8_30]
MEELWELRTLIQEHDYNGALALVDELEEMAKSDIIDKISSYAVILLLHLIKQIVEQRTTKSWDVSLTNSALKIQSLNRRRKSKGTYLNEEELTEALEEAYAQAVNRASVEALGSKLSAAEIKDLAPKDLVLAITLEKLD